MRSNKLDIVWKCLVDEARLFALATGSSTLFERGGITASIAPAAPDRSLFNCIVPYVEGSLEASYDELAAAYRASGVRAFTVWVDEHDSATKSFLSNRGHVLDASPRAMMAEIGAMNLVEADGLDCRETGDLTLVSRLNDAAYGWVTPAFSALLTSLPEEGEARWHAYEARHDGAPAGCLMYCDTPHGDAGVAAVATVPEARGRRIASRLLSFALREAASRGMRTTSLQATSKGKGVYARLGYEDIGVIEMWEHRP